MSDAIDYAGCRALVTGASSGIGRTLAVELARRGARVALVARRTEALEALAEEIRGAGGEALPLACDVEAAGAVERCSAAALEHFGTIDLLVNNAGYGHHRRFLDWDLADMERMMRVNYFGALRFTKHLLPAMVEQRRGWLVFVSSMAGLIATPGESAYAASKFAMRGLADALSIEVEEAGVHVLSVYPGVIRTPFFDDEALRRMPDVAKRGAVEPKALVAAMLSSLERGKRSLIFPRWLGVGAFANGLAPGLTRAGVRRSTLPALDRE